MQVEEAEYVEHPGTTGAPGPPLMFSFSGRDFFKSKKLAVAIEGGEDSDGIPIDAVGNAGRVTSTVKKGRSYNVIPLLRNQCNPNTAMFHEEHKYFRNFHHQFADADAVWLLKVAVSSTLSFNGLTKIITFTPFFLVDNRSKAALELREVDEALSPSWTAFPAQTVGDHCPKLTA